MTTRREFLTHTAATGILAAAAVQFAAPSKVAAHAARAGLVQTALGPIDASKLGFTLTHEHAGGPWIKSLGSRENAIAKAIGKLKEAKDAGVDTIVDVTTFDTGRDVRFSEEIARKSGMQIVVATGQHFFAPESLDARSLEEITELFVREIGQGIDGTDIKPGVIKVAARSAALAPAEEKVFRAAARASNVTGIPIIAHTDARQRAGEKQVEIFEAEKVDPARVSLSHSDNADDVNYLVGLAQRGYTLGMDHMFRGRAPGATVTLEKRAEYIKQLIDAGFVDKIFLSNDWVLGDVERDKLNPDGMLFNMRKTIPYLKKIGVSRRDIRVITVENPRRFFGRQPG